MGASVLLDLPAAPAVDDCGGGTLGAHAVSAANDEFLAHGGDVLVALLGMDLLYVQHVAGSRLYRGCVLGSGEQSLGDGVVLLNQCEGGHGDGCGLAEKADLDWFGRHTDPSKEQTTTEELHPVVGCCSPVHH